VFISLVSWNDLLERLNPTEEPFNGTAVLVEFRIEPEWPPSFRLSPGSPVDRDVALNPLFLVVLANLPGIVGCICRDDRGMILHLRNLKYQSTQFVPLDLFIAIIAGRSPFFAWRSLVSVAQCERSIFWISYPDRSRSRKIAWYTPFSHNSRWYR
jgi:hypothetical protein